MLKKTLFLLALTPTICCASYDSRVGTIEWFIEKNNTIYEQQKIMNPSKYNRTVGTMTKPLGTTKLPTYMPQRITPNSFARGMFNALLKRHPVATAATVGLGIYECVTADSGWCSGDPNQNLDPQCPDGGSLMFFEGFNICTIPAPLLPNFKATVNRYPTIHEFYGKTQEEAVAAGISAFRDEYIAKVPADYCDSVYCYTHSLTSADSVIYDANGSQRFEVKGTIAYSCAPNKTCAPKATTNHTFASFSSVAAGNAGDAYQCPPDGYPSFMTLEYDNGYFCSKPAIVPEPEPVKDVTLDDLKQWIAERPEIFQDISDDILKDPVNGKPDDTFFENPSHTPVSPQLSDALASTASGLAQNTNPSAPHYVPPEVQDAVRDALEKFHDGEPFVDPYTNTTVTPDSGLGAEPTPYQPPQELTVTVKQSWEDFPGITQAQYEQSNNGWAQQLADTLPNEQTDWATFDDEFKDNISQNPDLPFDPFNFGSLWPITGGQCTGFSRTVSVAGNSKTIVFDKHCPPYNEWAHPFLSWFLQILAALQILTIFNKTMLSGGS